MSASSAACWRCISASSAACRVRQEIIPNFKKGESIEDTIHCLECYADVMVLRHPAKGSTGQAAAVASKHMRGSRLLKQQG